jgi:hypothetical protein
VNWVGKVCGLGWRFGSVRRVALPVFGLVGLGALKSAIRLWSLSVLALGVLR